MRAGCCSTTVAATTQSEGAGSTQIHDVGRSSSGSNWFHVVGNHHRKVQVAGVSALVPNSGRHGIHTHVLTEENFTRYASGQNIQTTVVRSDWSRVPRSTWGTVASYQYLSSSYCCDTVGQAYVEGITHQSRTDAIHNPYRDVEHTSVTGCIRYGNPYRVNTVCYIVLRETVTVQGVLNIVARERCTACAER